MPPKRSRGPWPIDGGGAWAGCGGGPPIARCPDGPPRASSSLRKSAISCSYLETVSIKKVQIAIVKLTLLLWRGAAVPFDKPFRASKPSPASGQPLIYG